MRVSWIVISSMAAGDVTSNARVRAPREIRRARASGIASCLWLFLLFIAPAIRHPAETRALDNPRPHRG